MDNQQQLIDDFTEKLEQDFNNVCNKFTETFLNVTNPTIVFSSILNSIMLFSVSSLSCLLSPEQNKETNEQVLDTYFKLLEEIKKNISNPDYYTKKE